MKGKLPKGKKTRYQGYVITKYPDGSGDVKRNGRYMAVFQSGGVRKGKEWINMKV